MEAQKMVWTRKLQIYSMFQIPDASLGFGSDPEGKLSWRIFNMTSNTCLMVKVKAVHSLKLVDWEKMDGLRIIQVKWIYNSWWYPILSHTHTHNPKGPSKSNLELFLEGQRERINYASNHRQLFNVRVLNISVTQILEKYNNLFCYSAVIHCSLFQFQIALCSLKRSTLGRKYGEYVVFLTQLFTSGCGRFTFTLVGADPPNHPLPNHVFLSRLPRVSWSGICLLTSRFLRMLIIFVLLSGCFVLFLIFGCFSGEFRISMNRGRWQKTNFVFRVKCPP